MIRFRPLPLMTMSALPALVVLIGLGMWQVQRLHEKQDLLETIAQRMSAPEAPLADVLGGPLASAEWRRVRAHGRFLHDKEGYVHAVEPGLGLGVHVLTPLVISGWGTVLVDRGFVPLALRMPDTRAVGQTEGEVDITGIVRLSGEHNAFTPATDEARRTWYWRDVEGIARHFGLTLNAPVVIVAEHPANPGGLPRFAGYRVDIPNNHLQYAITWFGLALTLIGVYLAYHARNGHLRFS
jgi:surfeit locus 1 family protein